MDNSLKAGYYLVEAIKNDENLVALLGENKIWPLAAIDATAYPFVIYSRDQINVQYTKCCNHDNQVIITFRVYSNDYLQGLNIANTIRDLLEHKKLISDEIQINEIKITSVSEMYGEDAFCQSISFQMFVE